jgi:16S rRNA A1518/A1519 N6-dimethyltransferase RsmA/KsgA/DIM1 with predicted DNA glycosylase/AP lyase activity
VATPEERHRVRKVIEAAFGARRQMVVNALARRYGPALPKGTWTALLERLEIDPRRRAETLATADFVHLGSLVAEAEKSLDQNR